MWKSLTSIINFLGEIIRVWEFCLFSRADVCAERAFFFAESTSLHIHINIMIYLFAIRSRIRFDLLQYFISRMLTQSFLLLFFYFPILPSPTDFRRHWAWITQWRRCCWRMSAISSAWSRARSHRGRRRSSAMKTFGNYWMWQTERRWRQRKCVTLKWSELSFSFAFSLLFFVGLRNYGEER